MYDKQTYGFTEEESKALDGIIEDFEHDYINGNIGNGFSNMDVLIGLHARITQYKVWYLQEATEDELKSAESDFNVLKSLAVKFTELCTYDITDTINDIHLCSYDKLEAA